MHSWSRHNDYDYPNIYMTWVYKSGEFLMKDKDKNKFPNMRVTFVQRLTNVLLRILNSPPSLAPSNSWLDTKYLVLELPCCKSTLVKKLRAIWDLNNLLRVRYADHRTFEPSFMLD